MILNLNQVHENLPTLTLTPNVMTRVHHRLLGIFGSTACSDYALDSPSILTSDPVGKSHK